ncbi:MAG: hypothetical protein Q7V20_15305, partial [Aquabacterium sp.]|uniref:hypothetical protein n=1 Tax=Aquabacterium sp. TaxID=1872578 RepID=UPI0027165420
GQRVPQPPAVAEHRRAVRRNAVDRHHRSPARLRLIPAPHCKDKASHPTQATTTTQKPHP